jgi:hypothetical protein
VAGAAVLTHGRVQLALSALARLLVMTVFSEIGEDTRFLALLLEALERPLKVLVIMDYDFRQILLPPLVAFVAGYRTSFKGTAFQGMVKLVSRDQT